MPLIWLLMPGCTDAGPMEPCASTGVWDTETGGSFNSIHAAMATGAKEICLGPGTYALSCEPLVGPAFSVIGAGSELTEVRRPDCYDYIELDRPGGYRLEALALTTAAFFFNSKDTTELVDVVIRDTLTRGPSFSVAGPLSIDGLEIRDNDLGLRIYNLSGSGQVQNLWVHNNRLVANSTGMDNYGVDLQDVTIEGNHADGEQALLSFMLSEGRASDVAIINNPASSMVQLGDNAVLEDARIDLPLDFPSIEVDSSSATEVLRANLGSGYIHLQSWSSILASELEFDPVDLCNIRCHTECVGSSGALSCAGSL